MAAALSVYVDIIAIAVSGALWTLMYMQGLEPGMLLESIGKRVEALGFWGKPLGGCSYCTGFWVALLAFVTYWLCFPAWVLLTTLALSVAIISYLTYNDILP